MPEFGIWFDKYRKIREAANISKTTVDNEYKSHKAFWEYLREHHPSVADEISINKAYVQSYASYVNGRMDWKVNTKSIRLSSLKPFYKEAVTQEWMLVNPTLELQPPKMEEIVINVLTVKQVKELLSMPDLNTYDGLRNRAILELMYSTGIRSNEVFQIKIDDFSEDYRRVTIRGKGGRVDVIPVGKMAAHFARFYIENLRSYFFQPKCEVCFISTRHDKPMVQVNLNLILTAYGKQFNPPIRITPHTLRYSIATHLDDEGVDIRLIQEFLRHESINTTSHYISQGIKKLREVHSKTHPRECSV